MVSGRHASPLLVVNEMTLVIHAFPDDEGLLSDVRRTTTAAAATVQTEGALRRAVETALRAWYPRLTITCREELARLDVDEHVWYVLRDGRVRRPQAEIDRLYHVMSDARATSEKASETLRRSGVAMARASQPRSSIGRARRAATIAAASVGPGLLDPADELEAIDELEAWGDLDPREANSSDEPTSGQPLVEVEA